MDIIKGIESFVENFKAYGSDNLKKTNLPAEMIKTREKQEKNTSINDIISISKEREHQYQKNLIFDNENEWPNSKISLDIDKSNNATINIIKNTNIYNITNKYNHSNNSEKIEINIISIFNQIQGGLNEIKDKLPETSDEFKEVNQIQKDLDTIEDTTSPKEIAKSSVMSRLFRFFF